ncbi:MAG: hypothetical protein DRJ59_07215 [Thermoprotei archaeon]|nr:MAG: hypothetical protein DRJ59_07215 [Thermoprotei archaeon]
MAETTKVLKGFIVLALTSGAVFLLYRIILHMNNIINLSFDDLTLHFVGVFAIVLILILIAIVSKEES